MKRNAATTYAESTIVYVNGISTPLVIAILSPINRYAFYRSVLNKAYLL